MKKPILLFALLFASIIISSCGNKKENKTEWVNPVFKENLTEIFDIISKRYVVDFTEVKKKFDYPMSVEIDSVQSEENEFVYDSTFVYNYKKLNFHFYKRSTDKKYILTEIDLTGEFKAKQFVLSPTTTRDEILALFGDPAVANGDENREELTYALVKDENGAFYDSFIFILIEGKFSGMRYLPYVEIYTQANEQPQELGNAGQQ